MQALTERTGPENPKIAHFEVNKLEIDRSQPLESKLPNDGATHHAKSDTVQHKDGKPS